MSDKYRIAVLGIGGVGGYFGGKLAKHFANSKDVEIIFIARGENAKAIQTHGLKIILSDDEFIARPHLITNDPQDIGKIDLFIICTKSYDLAESINNYRDLIGAKTAILPLLNGVNHTETVQSILPKAEVWNGCCFIVARLISAGVVKVDSEIRLIQFGSFTGSKRNLNKVEKIFKSAGIQTELSQNINQTIWEKFIFISSLATLTSYLDKNVGEILGSAEYQQILVDLISEVTNLARAKNIKVLENIEELTLEKIKKAPSTATSSMHADFAKKGKTELETLTGFVVREAKLLNVATPVYSQLYEDLQKR